MKIKYAWILCIVFFLLFPQTLFADAENDPFSADSSVPAAPLKNKTWQIHYATASELQKNIQGSKPSLLSSEGMIFADDRTNRLWMRDHPDQLNIVNDFILHFDLPAPQILIKVRIVTVDDKYARALGLDFTSTHATTATGSGMAMDLPSGNDTDNTFTMPIAKFSDGSFINVRLMALEEEGHAKTISDPELMTSNRQTSEIESGEDVPYQEQTGTGNTSTAFKKAALKVQVTPMLMPHQKMLLKIAVNQDKISDLTVKGVPAIRTQHVDTQVLVQNKHTVVLGGIYEENNGVQTESIPGLNRIPLIGVLFSQQHKTHERQELFIFVTPAVVGE